MSVLIKGLDIDSHRVIKCFIVPYKDRAQLVIGNKYDEGKTYDIFEVSVPQDLGSPEVIPCKECKWHGYLTCSNPNGIKGWVTDNDFCSYVERRENGCD